jgi:phage baseplate assembly protein gpV
MIDDLFALEQALRHLQEHVTDLTAAHADLEARIERTHRKGKVTDVDAKKHLYRQEIGLDDNGNTVKSPWLPYAQIAGDLKVHSPPTVGEQYLIVNPDGSPDFTQSVGVPHGWYDKNPSPSTDPHADVTVRGTTLAVRTMAVIWHSIGGKLTGPMQSMIEGGVTRLIDKLGHHISAPGQTVDVTTKTTLHTSSESNTDTATKDLTRLSLKGNIDCTALKGDISHNAATGSIVNSAATLITMTAPVINIS